MTEKQTDWIKEEMYQHELRQQRTAWEQRKKAEAEQRDRERKQRELQSHLTHRSREFLDYIGEQPTREDLSRWRAEFLDELERKHQAERRKKLAQIEAEHYNY